MTNIFTPLKIGTVQIKNRFVMTAAHLNWCKEGYVSPEVVRFYKNRARGGVGLIIAGAAGIDPVRMNTTGMMQVCDDKYIPGLKRITDAVHEEKGRVFLQLMHAGAYARMDEHGGQTPVAPSEYKSMFTGEQTRELSVDDIHTICGYFADAALRAQKAGFDGVEVIGSAGYLVAEFLSKATNKREDNYGGSQKARIKFLMEILEAIKEAVGKDFPLIVRLSGSDFIPGGNGPEEFLETGSLISESGLVDAIDVTGGWHESRVPQITYTVPKSMYLYLPAALKKRVKIPVIGCNRLTPQEADFAVKNHQCDLAGMLRAFIADPLLPEAYKKDELIRPCLYCNQECLEKIFSQRPLGCVVNPLVGQSGELKSERIYRDEGKNILVIGAGPAGLTYAALASEKNNITLWEKRPFFGGNARAVSISPDREDVRAYLEYLYERCLKNQVKFSFGKEVDESLICRLLEKRDFDHIVLACGSLPGEYDFEITGDVKIWSAPEFILNRNTTAAHVCIAGSTYQAVQTAFYIVGRFDAKSGLKNGFIEKYAPEYTAYVQAFEKEYPCSVTLIGEAKRAGGGFGKSVRHQMLSEMKRCNIKYIPEARLVAVDGCGAEYEKTSGERGYIPADTIILCKGEKPHKRALMLEGQYPGKVTVIGDARGPARISEAIKAAFDAALNTQGDRPQIQFN